MESLTEKQLMVLRFLTEYYGVHGYPPSVRDLCTELGFKSPNTAHFHLKALQEKGYIRIAPGRNRGITILRTPLESGDRIPLVGSIAAGAPILAVENVEDTLKVDRGFFGAADAFSVRVEGDSMTGAHIADGDYVVIRPGGAPRNGDIVAALVDDEVTLKYLYKDADCVELRPANSKYDPLRFSGHEGISLRILGVMVGLIRKA